MKRLKVLVLEDNRLVAEGLKETLKHLGHECVLAGRVDEARVIAVESPELDVALVDAGLQDGEYGVDFLLWLATHRPAVQRILISGLEPSEVRHSVVDHFLKKPFGLAELSSALSIANRQRQA